MVSSQVQQVLGPAGRQVTDMAKQLSGFRVRLEELSSQASQQWERATGAKQLAGEASQQALSAQEVCASEEGRALWMPLRPPCPGVAGIQLC